MGLLQGPPRAEFELVGGEVRSLLDAGVAAEEIAIVHRSPQRIAALLAEALSAQGCLMHCARGAAFADTAVGRACSALLRCAAGRSRRGEAS